MHSTLNRINLALIAVLVAAAAVALPAGLEPVGPSLAHLVP
ncbi:hypothetical protein [Thetidibacter halocola]|jgi:hypothetical protein|nr:hypothetical protein [Thetidibacter halocola]